MVIVSACGILDAVADLRSVILPYIAGTIGILEVLVGRGPVVTDGDVG